MSYYDRLNALYKRFEQDAQTPAAQLVCLHLAHINNCFGNSEEFFCTDDRLKRLTGLSKDAITDAKRRLKNAGLIDFSTLKNKPRLGTCYRFKFCAQSGSEKINQRRGL